MVEILKYDNPDHKTKLKTQHIQVKVKSTRKINNTVWITFTNFRKMSVTRKELFWMLLLGKNLCTERLNRVMAELGTS